MTPRQIELARHALGLRPGCLVSRRNILLASMNDPDFGPLEGMVADGFATKTSAPLMRATYSTYRLTRAGAERALLPGDVLDAEEWGT